MIRGVVVQMTTDELVKCMRAKADWYEEEAQAKPKIEQERWLYDADLFRFVAAHLPANETFELTVEEMRVWVHFELLRNVRSKMELQ